MESVLSDAYRLKLQNFEGPFDLLFHLIEKNKINIYDIRINEITDQYMQYLFDMKKLNMEIASAFLIMASTLLHIKSRMLLPQRNREEDEEEDPREELILRLMEFKKYKEFSRKLKSRVEYWEAVQYRMPEFTEVESEYDITDISKSRLVSIYDELLRRNIMKMNTNKTKMKSIIKRENVTLRSKVKEIIGTIAKNGSFIFSELFSFKKKSATEIVTGFLAMLELARLKKLSINQKNHLGEIKVEGKQQEYDEKEITAAVGDGYGNKGN